MLNIFSVSSKQQHELQLPVSVFKDLAQTTTPTSPEPGTAGDVVLDMEITYRPWSGSFAELSPHELALYLHLLESHAVGLTLAPIEDSLGNPCVPAVTLPGDCDQQSALAIVFHANVGLVFRLHQIEDLRCAPSLRLSLFRSHLGLGRL